MKTIISKMLSRAMMVLLLSLFVTTITLGQEVVDYLTGEIVSILINPASDEQISNLRTKIEKGKSERNDIALLFFHYYHTEPYANDKQLLKNGVRKH